MKVWTDPLWPRIKASLHRNRTLLRDVETVLLFGYLTYVVGWWAFGERLEVSDDEPVCAAEGCHEPATTENFTGVVMERVDDDGFCWAVELVCARHKEER